MNAFGAIQPIDDTDGDMVLFDRIAYSIGLRYAHTGDQPRRQLILALLASGQIRSAPHPNAPIKFHMVVEPRPGISAKVKVKLHARDLADGLVFGSASTLEMNLQLPLREKHKIPQKLVGYDGKRNFVRPTCEMTEDDLELQFEVIELAIETLKEIIENAVPSAVLVDGKLLLKAAEVCHDMACPNAEDVVRATCRVPLRGTRESLQREYACTTGEARMPTWRVSRRKRGPDLKGYVKWRQYIRTENSCPHHDAVVLCVGQRTSAPFSGEGASHLAMEFYEAAGEMCCEALDHVRDVMRGTKTVYDLLVQLNVLKLISERVAIDGGYRPSEESARDAKRALNALLTTGIFHATGLRKGTKVRDALDALSAPGGPLVQGASPGIFCVAPEYGMALPGWDARTFPLVLIG